MWVYGLTLVTQNGVSSYNHAGGLVSKGNSALGKTFRLEQCQIL
jgi:hypothetical protein